MVYADDYVTVVNDTANCVDGRPEVCSGFRVYDLGPDVSDENSPYFYGCGNDGPGSETSVAGEWAGYQELAMYCGGIDDPNEDRFAKHTKSWMVSDRNLLIHTLDLRGRPRIDLESALADATWK